MNKEFSENEIALFSHYGYGELAEVWSSINAMPLYRMCVEKAFLCNDQSEWAEKLRRVYNAITKHKPFRMTPEFENLF